ATEARAASELTAYAESLAAKGKSDALTEDQAFAFSAEMLHRTHALIETDPQTFAISQILHEELADVRTRKLIREGMSEARYREIGKRVIAARGAFKAELDDEIANMTREQARDFARKEVA